MSRWIRWSGAAAVWLGVMALSTGDGMAADSASSGAASPKFSTLPEIALGGVPNEKDRPKTVPASSRFTGLWWAMQKPDKRHHYGVPGQRQIGLFVSKDDATAFKDRTLHRWESRPKDSQHPAAATTCFAVLNHWELSQDHHKWPLRLQQWPQVRAAAPGTVAAKQSPDYQKVRAFQIERLVISTTKKPGATLHLQQGWFDPVSFGAKETKSITAEFTLVATGPGGVQVFVARDKAEKRVEFVVYNPMPDKKARGTIGRHMQSRMTGHTGSSDCGHVRLSLQTSPGAGDYGSAQFEIVLPDDASSKRKAKMPRDKSVTKGERAAEAGAREPREVRIRKLAVHVGVSQGLKEKAPTTTVAFGWVGRVRRQQIF